MNISKILKLKTPPKLNKKQVSKLKDLKLTMLRSQQSAFFSGKRIVIVFEGFDAAGKGTCIRHLTQSLDPRSIHVIPIGPPNEDEKNQHYLQRFWVKLPQNGHIVVFDRSWYGRVLVEKVENLTTKKRVNQAYQEINQFEKMLINDGVILIKIFLVVSKSEQLKRFNERLNNPIKGWKITKEDIQNRRNWDKYVEASDLMIKKCPNWHVISSDNKPYARLKVLEIVTKVLSPMSHAISMKVKKTRLVNISKQLLELND